MYLRSCVGFWSSASSSPLLGYVLGSKKSTGLWEVIGALPSRLSATSRASSTARLKFCTVHVQNVLSRQL